MADRPQFHIRFDTRGDLYAMEGFVICKRSGAFFACREGTPDGALQLTGQLAVNGSKLADFPNAEAGTFLGGSGRNLIMAGLPVAVPDTLPSPDGIYRAGKAAFWGRGVFTVEVTGPSDATISDETDVVAILSSGGTAPLGSYVATSYGEDEYNGGDPFTLTASGEPGWPGAAFDIDVGVGEGSAQQGRYTSTDSVVWTSAVDSDWTITLNSDGSADWRYDGTVIARRETGPADDPCGIYASVPAGEFLNPEFTEDDDAEPAEVNPFGSLELEFSWAGTPDLDIGVTFLGETAGWGHSEPSTGGPVGDFMTWSGDNTSTGGPETVTIDLAAAWEAGVISGFATVAGMADWFPSAGGSGPASVAVTYTPPIGSPVSATYTLHPGRVTPAATPAVGVRIDADGTMTRASGPWTAVVQAYRRAPAAGVVFIAIAEGAAAVDSVAGPFFAASLPGVTPAVVPFPIGTSDGSGVLKQIHSGTLVWDIRATDRVRVGTVTNSTDSGDPGDLRVDGTHVQVCIAPDTWSRAALDAAAWP